MKRVEIFRLDMFGLAAYLVQPEENKKSHIYTTLPFGKVEYKCLIDFVINRDTLLEMPEEEVFIPHFRKQCFQGTFRRRNVAQSKSNMD